MIKAVFRFQNDMVMVFNADGEQIPEYQGQYEEVKGGILRDASPDAVFALWFGGDTEPETVSREEWQSVK